MNERSFAEADHFRPLRLADLWNAILRHRWSVILWTIFLLPLFVVGVFLIPAKFDSYGQVLIRLGRGAVSMDPTATLSPTVSLQDSRASQVNSVREMLQSRAIAQKVVRDVGVQRILEPHSLLSQTIEDLTSHLPGGAPKAMGDLSAEEVETQIAEEMAIKAFQDSLGLFMAKDAYTIDLEVRTEDPFLSRDLLESLIRIYREHHAMAHSSSGSLKFFEEQTDRAYARAVTAKEKLREAKTERGIIDIGSAQAALRALISQVESNLVDVEHQLASTKSERDQLVNQIAEQPETLQTQTIRGIPKATGDGMRQALYDLEVRYKEQSLKLSEDHPKLKVLREQLAAATEIAQAEQGERPQTTEATNPVRQALELSLQQTNTQLSGLESKRENLQSQAMTLRKELADLNRDEVELAELTWETQLAESEYMRTAENRDNARLIDQLSSGAVSEIAVVQEPSLGLKKVKPKRSILLILAAAVAFGFGIVQALLRGLFWPAKTDSIDAQRNPPTRRRTDPGHGHYRKSDVLHAGEPRGFDKPPEPEPAREQNPTIDDGSGEPNESPNQPHADNSGGLTALPR
ncbi:Wzz/FepE/Etk N-terminal domain-containing protein [Rhodopirellula sp. JC740]|uniref:Wzz/FepE/Etk N-terminal domain-containing protein n=1 Tax=Rhodopirellula halodulae TaxID=2894198 RepID=A0ABS8NNC0_9BACT|nr:Wzz/FepE/Etk N-terminal domain-containing protein [Rhodopirellula sp. JC740]MCC9645094.1 Wzz/FepE/Etk N-terminal domain-containing protein [Rhodopirellula sp. JC740]